MQIDTTHIDFIKASFKQMQTKEDFLNLLNYAKPYAYAGKTIPFEIKQLNFYLKNRKPVEQSVQALKGDVTEKPDQNVLLIDIQKKGSDKKTIIEADSRYLSFQIKKKSGGQRTIHAPKPGLKALQKTLSFILQTVFRPHPSAMGFVQGKSIVNNANVHTGQNYVYNIDLVDFFPSVDQARVWKCLQLKPFDLTQNHLNRNGIPTSRIAILNTFLQPHSIEKLITDLTERFVEETPTFYLHLFRALNAFDASTNNFKCNPDFYYAQGTERTKIKLTEESTEIFNRLFINLDQVNNELEFKEFNSLIISWMTKLRKFGEMLAENARAMTVELKLEDEEISISQVIKNIYATNIFKIDPRQEIASMIASLCCIEVPNGEIEKNRDRKFPKNVLPQGAPTSPMFSNVICQRLDYLLSAVAKRFGLKYSRYADDVTFSSMHNVYQPGSKFLIELERIITQQGFKVNPKKTRLHKDGYRKEVTGLLVNEKANVQKRYIKQLRMWLYYWEQYGYEKAYSFFLQQYMADKASIVKGKPSMTNVIRGKLDYLKMVKGGENEMYLKLKKRFDLLTGDEKSNNKFNVIQVNKETKVKTKAIETVKFLKHFKFDSEYSFKDLVHIPVDKSHFDYYELLRIAYGEFINIVASKDNIINLPKSVVEGVQKLFQHLSSNGLEYYRKTGNHPLEDKATGNIIQKFKGDYRFGNEVSESSIFSTLLRNVANKRAYKDHNSSETFSFGETDTSGLFRIDQLSFYPDILRFQSKANFFTWVPNVTNALSLIYDSILKHSNVNGSRNFISLEKKIIIDINRKFEGNDIKIELSILDKGSLFLGNIHNILAEMRRDFFPVLVGICDFKIQFLTTENTCYECQVLPYAETIEQISSNAEGFKYIFTFYD